MADSIKFLRNVLFADGLTSALTGGLLVILGGPVARAIGAGSPLLMEAIGVGLIGFGAVLIRSARRGVAVPSTARVAVASNAVWVAASAVVLLGGWLRVGGNWAVVLVTSAVLVFTLLEIVGLRRVGAQAERPAPGARTSVAIVLLALAGGGVHTSTAQSTNQVDATDEAAVRAVVAQTTDGWNRRDMRGVSALFNADGVLISGGGVRTEGRQEVERYLGEVAAGLPDGTQFMATVTSVRFLDRAIAIVESKGGFVLPGDGAVTAARLGVQSIILVREGGAWHVVLYQRTRVLPPNPPDAENHPNSARMSCRSE